MHKLARLAGLAALFAGITLAIGVSPASAHHPILSGTTTCPNADHLIAWSIGNSHATQTMTITAASADLNGTTYTVDGYNATVAPLASTSASSVIPGALTGTVTITVSGKWTDGHTATRTATVDLVDPCPFVPPTTTTTTSITTPTSVPPTTVPGTPPPTIKPPSPPHGTNGGSGTPHLAFTGSDSGWLLLIGFGLVLAGFGVICRLRARETHAQRRML